MAILVVAEAEGATAEQDAVMVKALDHGGRLCAMASEEEPEIIPIPEGFRTGKYCLLFDPLDGSIESAEHGLARHVSCKSFGGRSLSAFSAGERGVAAMANRAIPTVHALRAIQRFAIASVV